MKKWKVPVYWGMSAIVEVEADTLEDAIYDAEHNDIPLSEGEYVSGSFLVDGGEKYIRSVYNNNEPDDKQDDTDVGTYTIFENAIISVTREEGATDVLATVVNKTNNKVRIDCFIDEEFETFSIDGNDYVDILPNDSGYHTLNAIENKKIQIVLL